MGHPNAEARPAFRANSEELAHRAGVPMVVAGQIPAPAIPVFAAASDSPAALQRGADALGANGQKVES